MRHLSHEEPQDSIARYDTTPRSGSPTELRGEEDATTEVASTAPASAAGIPAHTHQTVPWRQRTRMGPREDRTFNQVTVSIPPAIADQPVSTPTHLIAPLEAAIADLAALDVETWANLAPVEQFLLSSESIASSKIEAHAPGTDDIARAWAGVRATQDARITVAAARALRGLVDATATHQRIHLDDIYAAHHTLMRDDPHDGHTAGKPREEQNWIGGSDYSPRSATYVPPPHEHVPGLMADLVTFANRNDMPALVQAAIVHAQFESIHPFTDGNGRIGRTLINAVLRHRGTMRHGIAPLATAMVAQRDHYFGLITRYRDGDTWAFVDYLTRCSSATAIESRESARRLISLPTEWATLTRPRKGSAAHTLLGALLANPVLTSDTARDLTGASETSTFDAINSLVVAGVLRQAGQAKRDRVWVAADVVDEVESLQQRLSDRLAT